MLSLAQRYNVRPSSLLGELDDYTAYCFDEACAVIMTHLDKDEEPTFVEKYSSFSSLYAKYE